MYWDEKAECMTKEEKEKIQLERLKKTVKLAYENVEFYKKRFDEIGLKYYKMERIFVSTLISKKFHLPQKAT